jgi:hypothetical protein
VVISEVGEWRGRGGPGAVTAFHWSMRMFGSYLNRNPKNDSSSLPSMNPYRDIVGTPSYSRVVWHSSYQSMWLKYSPGATSHSRRSPEEPLANSTRNKKKQLFFKKNPAGPGSCDEFPRHIPPKGLPEGDGGAQRAPAGSHDWTSWEENLWPAGQGVIPRTRWAPAVVLKAQQSWSAALVSYIEKPYAGGGAVRRVGRWRGRRIRAAVVRVGSWHWGHLVVFGGEVEEFDPAAFHEGDPCRGVVSLGVPRAGLFPIPLQNYCRHNTQKRGGIDNWGLGGLEECLIPLRLVEGPGLGPQAVNGVSPPPRE